VNYHTTEVDSSLFSPKTNHDDLIGFFVQNELKIFDDLIIIAGIKYEENSFTGADYSPRGCILYSPWPDHHFRFSVSRAFRTPSFGEDSSYFVKHLPPPFPPLPLLSIVGNEHLDPEKMTAFELGYRTILFKKIGFNLELYYNELDKVIDIGVPEFIWPFQISFDNKFNAIAKGIEIAIDFPVTPWWTLKANYTFQEAERKRDDKDIRGTPKHKFNLSSHFTFKNGFFLDVRAHFVDKTKWSEVTHKAVKVDDYLRVDLRISKKFFNDRVELSFIGQNLTDKLHPETSDATATYEIERLLYGQITLCF